MDIAAAFVANAKASKLMEPGERALDHPTIAPQSLARLDHRAGDPAQDVARPKQRLVLPRAIRFVRVQFVGPLARAAPPPARHGDHEIDQVREHGPLVHVGRRQLRDEWDPIRVGEQMVLRARLAAIRRIRAGGGAPFFAGTLDASRTARDQSSWSASLNRSRSTWCSVYHTPASCQSRRRRQHVMPEPHPISCGSISHGRPVFRTKMIPVRHARSGTRGRPPLGFGGSGGSNGSIIAQSASGTNNFDCFDCTSTYHCRDNTNRRQRTTRYIQLLPCMPGIVTCS
jgi:hypothetical protein